MNIFSYFLTEGIVKIFRDFENIRFIINGKIMFLSFKLFINYKMKLYSHLKLNYTLKLFLKK